MKATLLIICFLITSICFSQKALSVGDKVPDIVFKNVLNYKSKTAKLSDFKGKLVILDFWDISCVSCIAAMPKMDSLQKEFGNKIQIVLITKNNKEEVDKLFSRVKIIRPDLPMIINDKEFQKLFPHFTVPHHVWIDSKGDVRFITNSYNTTARNINDFLMGRKIGLHYKNDNLDIDLSNKPLISEIDKLSSHLKYYSIIMDWMPEVVKAGSGFNNDSVSRGLKLINKSILNLFKAAFGHNIFNGKFDHDNRVKLEIGNAQELYYPIDKAQRDTWSARNIFCYESRVPLSNEADLYKIMEQEVNNAFTYFGKVEKRKVNCLILRRTSSEDKISSSGAKANIKYLGRNEGITFINKPVSDLVKILDDQNLYLPTPIIDGTGYTANIDIEIRGKLNDINSLRQELRRFGLDLIEDEIEIEVLVITDKAK